MESNSPNGMEIYLFIINHQRKNSAKLFRCISVEYLEIAHLETRHVCLLNVSNVTLHSVIHGDHHHPPQSRLCFSLLYLFLDVGQKTFIPPEQNKKNSAPLVIY